MSVCSGSRYRVTHGVDGVGCYRSHAFLESLAPERRAPFAPYLQRLAAGAPIRNTVRFRHGPGDLFLLTSGEYWVGGFTDAADAVLLDGAADGVADWADRTRDLRIDHLRAWEIHHA